MFVLTQNSANVLELIWPGRQILFTLPCFGFESAGIMLGPRLYKTVRATSICSQTDLTEKTPRFTYFISHFMSFNIFN